MELLKRNIKLFYIVEFISYLNFFVPIWVAYERHFLSFTAMSAIAGFRFAITILLEVPTGALGDLIGRKWSVTIGFFAEVIGLIIVAIATNGNFIFIGAIFRGAADAFRSGSDSSLVFDSLKELKIENTFGKVKAKASLGTQFAFIISSILAGYLFNIDKSLPYFAYAFFLFVSGICYILMKEPHIDSEKFSIKNYIKQTKEGVKHTFQNRYISVLSTYFALVGGISLSWQMYFNQILASEIGYNEVQKSWLFAIIRFVNTLIVIRLLHLEKLISKKRAYIFFPVLLIISSIPAIIPSQILITILLFTATFANTSRSIVLEQYVNENFVSKYRATAISTLNLFVSIVYLIIVTASGPVIDHISVKFYYFIMGVIALVLILPQGIYLSRKHWND